MWSQDTYSQEEEKGKGNKEKTGQKHGESRERYIYRRGSLEQDEGTVLTVQQQAPI